MLAAQRRARYQWPIWRCAGRVRTLTTLPAPRLPSPPRIPKSARKKSRSTSEQRLPLRPALQRAAQALCDATTPEAARAAADALDEQCAALFTPTHMECREFGLASEFIGARTARGTELTLTEALLGASASTMIALLGSSNSRHVNLAAALMSCRRLHVIPFGKAALGGSAVFYALLDALLKAEKPAMRAIAAGGGGESAGGGAPAMALDNLVCALSEALNTWPKTAERLAAAPQRDAVLHLVARLYKPLRRADAYGSLTMLHSSVTSVLQSLSGRESGALLQWTHARDIVRMLLACMVAQGAAACKRPITQLYVPYEAACACSVLCNLLRPLRAREEHAVALHNELCAAGLPASLRALLHESSALLSTAADDMAALPPVVDLLVRLLVTQRMRDALLNAAPDGGGKLLLTLRAISAHHPHTRNDGTAPHPQQNAAVMARRVHLKSDPESEAALAAAARQLAVRLGWDSSPLATTAEPWLTPATEPQRCTGPRRSLSHSRSAAQRGARSASVSSSLLSVSVTT